jgi:hypothetical protein
MTETNNIQELNDQALLKEITQYLNVINTLTEEQSPYIVNDDNWIDYEKQIIEAECNLINRLLFFQMTKNIESNLLTDKQSLVNEQLQLIPIIGLHLYKYFDNDVFNYIIDKYLSQTAKTVIISLVAELQKVN